MVWAVHQTLFPSQYKRKKRSGNARLALSDLYTYFKILKSIEILNLKSIKLA